MYDPLSYQNDFLQGGDRSYLINSKKDCFSPIVCSMGEQRALARLHRYSIDPRACRISGKGPVLLQGGDPLGEVRRHHDVELGTKTQMTGREE